MLQEQQQQLPASGCVVFVDGHFSDDQRARAAAALISVGARVILGVANLRHEVVTHWVAADDIDCMRDSEDARSAVADEPAMASVGATI